MLMNSCIRKVGNVLFNNTLNTFFLRLYAIRHMVKDHSDSERGNALSQLHVLLFFIGMRMGNFIYVSIYLQVSDMPAHGHSQ